MKRPTRSSSCERKKETIIIYNNAIGVLMVVHVRCEAFGCSVSLL